MRSFRNSYHPRIAVTVDMIATGTDIKPVEIVVFMRAVKSRSFFEQMKGRGVRIIKPDDLKAVTPDATTKDHFVIVDTVGVCEQDKTDARPMEKKPSVAFEKLLQAVALGNIEEDVLTSIAGRLARMEHRITKEDEQAISKASGGLSLKDLSRQLVEAVNPDRQEERARQQFGTNKPSEHKLDPYESGMPSEIKQGFRFGISFYLIAMLFLLFDIEVLFLYPIAVQLRAYGTFALVETIVFVVLLLVAFIYVWRRGALTWK